MGRTIMGAILAVLAVGAAALWVFDPSPAGKAGAGKAAGPVAVSASRVGLSEFVHQIEAVGTAQARESVVITARVTETVDRVAFEGGERVKKDQPLAWLSSAQEEAELREAQVDVVQQRREYERLLGLVAQKAIPQFELDEQVSRLDGATARLAAAEARVSDRRILAPFDGVLGIRRVSPGALVEPGDVITTLDDIAVIKLDFQVPETASAAVRPGQTVRAMSAATPGRVFTGEVAGVNSRVDPVTRAVTVRAHIPNPEGLIRPGMLLSVRLRVDSRQSLTLPEGALVPLGRQQFVYRIDGAQRAERVAVTLGRRRPGAVEVLAGLEAGDWVIVEGTLKVKPGTEVSVLPPRLDSPGADESSPGQGEAPP